MGNRHLVISDIHENHEAIMRLILKARKIPGGFCDIWFLGDFFGHSEDADGKNHLTQNCLLTIEDLFQLPLYCVFGNWEYWLAHPENDEVNDGQRGNSNALGERREILKRTKTHLLQRLMRYSILELPETRPEFTLFHGCSFSCHDTAAYHADPWESYINPHDLNIVTRNLFGNADHLKTPHFLFGHTHIPGFFVYSKTSFVNMWRIFSPEMARTPIYYGNENQRFGINPGSAGITQMNFPRTAIILDTKEKTFQYIVDHGDPMRIYRNFFLTSLSMRNRQR
jgi:predicted phosphodiesterase